MLVVCDFGTLLDADISGITIHYLIIFPKKMLCLCNIMHICCSDGNRVNKSTACVYTDIVNATLILDHSDTEKVYH